MEYVCSWTFYIMKHVEQMHSAKLSTIHFERILLALHIYELKCLLRQKIFETRWILLYKQLQSTKLSSMMISLKHAYFTKFWVA